MSNYNKELQNRFIEETKNEYLGLDKPVNKIQPLVSISVATYQHKDFIKDCIEGILMQQVNFLYEIIIGDDGSVDGTTEICKAYAEKYPDKIRLFIRDRNTSHYYEKGKFIGRFNGIWCRMSCRGKYTALCEGDDYWTDPLKLQKQVDFLEENEDFGSCFTLYNRYFQKENRFEENSLPHLDNVDENLNGLIVTTDNFTKDWYTQVLTMLAHRDLVLSIDRNNYKYFRDNHLCYHLVKSKKSICFNYSTAVYRKHDNGVFTGISHKNNYEQHYLIYEELYLNNLDDINLKNSCFKMLYQLTLNYQLIDLLEFYSKILMKEGKTNLYFSYNFKQQKEFFRKLNIKDQIFLTKESIKRYVATIIQYISRSL